MVIIPAATSVARLLVRILRGKGVQGREMISSPQFPAPVFRTNHVYLTPTLRDTHIYFALKLVVKTFVTAVRTVLEKRRTA